MTTSLDTIKQLAADIRQQFSAHSSGGLEGNRRYFDESGLKTPLPKGIAVQPLAITPSLSADWIYPVNQARLSTKILLYLHGGGFSTGSSASHRPLCARLAHHCACKVLVLNYRLAPEHKYPSALEDVLYAYQWLLQRHAARDIVLAGDSAGGGLAMATLLALKQKMLPMPAGAAGLSAWLDLECSSASYEKNRDIDVMASAEGLRFVGRAYANKQINRDPLISPFYSDDLSGLCPLLLQIGNAETLLDENIRFAEQAKQDGVTVALQIWPNMVHVWHSLYGAIPEAEAAMDALGEWLDSLS